MTMLTSRGLEDVVACRSAICAIDGARGKLSYRGFDIDDLAGATFEEVCFLLWNDSLPNAARLEALRAQLTAEAPLPDGVLALLRGLPRDAHPLTALRTAISALGALDPEAEDGSVAANARKAVRLVAQAPRLVAAWERLRHGLEPCEPLPGDGIAAGFLRGLTGAEPDGNAVRALDTALILHADHELNASTFALRVAVATEADLHSAVTAACAVLKGPKHGGANEDVLEMIEEIGTPARAETWVKQKLAWRETLPPAERQQIKARFSGFGHRVYKVDDPRAAHLRRMAQTLARENPRTANWLAVAERVREVVAAEKGLPVNVDYYSTLVYQSLGIPVDLNLSIFAIARMAGWTAHALEQYADNRLIRPRAEYTGETGRAYRPLAERV